MSSVEIYQGFKEMFFTPGSSQTLNQLKNCLETDGRFPALLVAIEEHLACPDELEFEFNRLCIGPTKVVVAPYESVYISGRKRIFTDDSVRVGDFYQRLGLTSCHGFNEPPDYFGNELEFLYCLELLQQSPENAEILPELIEMKAEFFVAHLGRWGYQFLSDMGQKTKLEFWRVFCESLSAFLREQQADLSDGRSDLGLQS